ncbi:patatin-like phospholipase family protein [Desulfuribacillus alkaliarsenatis]|uniref:Esterase n=1 Tax=Desulfuribacillus alkaliarsenatis TaxID=766136 RepID=A0A1E5G5U6_9FIRM|nr:patatin-like phospholipase family protein [Desulfuribacillus alkaliarsenatis]OEF98551.1 esterase [Desulfuribacillus alkaliarsenatis]
MGGQKLGVALGAGGARGLAHIGVLQALKEMDVKIDCIAGSSIGSMIAAFYGNKMDLRMVGKFLASLNRKHWLDLCVPGLGLVTGDKFKEIVKLLTHNKNIEDLSIPIAIVATDLEKGERVVFLKGPIYQAVRASCSIPGIFVPEKVNGNILVDGGVIDRVPTSVVKDLGADYTIAVDVAPKKSEVKISTMFDVIAQTIDILEAEILKLRLLDADVVIQPKVGHIGIASFDKVEECIESGYIAAYEKEQQIISLLKNKRGDSNEL